MRSGLTSRDVARRVELLDQLKGVASAAGEALHRGSRRRGQPEGYTNPLRAFKSTSERRFHETTDTVGKSGTELQQQQEQQYEETEDTVRKLGAAIGQFRGVAVDMGDVLVEQNAELGELATNVDRVKGRVRSEGDNIGKVKTASKGHCRLVMANIIAFVVLMVLALVDNAWIFGYADDGNDPDGNDPADP
jgi:hypothetical protein